ncbi:hypothetical protein ACU686_36765 [Yinghuangia aomiensis]
MLPFDALIEDLYDVMFERHPYLRALFPESMAFPRTHLARMFDYLVDRLDRPEEIAATFAGLGERPPQAWRPGWAPRALARRSRMRWARRCGGGAGCGWTAAAEDAWLRMLRFAVAAMVDGADAAADRAAVLERDGGRPPVAAAGHRGDPGPAARAVRSVRRRPVCGRGVATGRAGVAGVPAGEHAGAGREVEFHVRATGAGGVNDALVFLDRGGGRRAVGGRRGWPVSPASAKSWGTGEPGASMVGR